VSWLASQSTCLHPANQSAQHAPGTHVCCPIACFATASVSSRPNDAQNAGKSSLINAMRQAARLPKEKDVTTAPLPGTTLGEQPGACT